MIWTTLLGIFCLGIFFMYINLFEFGGLFIMISVLFTPLTLYIYEENDNLCKSYGLTESKISRLRDYGDCWIFTNEKWYSASDYEKLKTLSQCDKTNPTTPTSSQEIKSCLKKDV